MRVFQKLGGDGKAINWQEGDNGCCREGKLIVKEGDSLISLFPWIVREGLSARDKADFAAASTSNNTTRSAGSLKPHRKLYIAAGAGDDGWVVVTCSPAQSWASHTGWDHRKCRSAVLISFRTVRALLIAVSVIALSCSSNPRGKTTQLCVQDTHSISLLKGRVFYATGASMCVCVCVYLFKMVRAAPGCWALVCALFLFGLVTPTSRSLKHKMHFCILTSYFAVKW